MQISARLYGTLRRFSSPGTPGRWQGQVPDGCTIAGLIAILGSRLEEVAAAAVNGEPVVLEAILHEGDTVTLVTPVGGGSNEPASTML